jgi:hypothetical protein
VESPVRPDSWLSRGAASLSPRPNITVHLNRQTLHHAKISGTVTDRDNRPLPGVTVTLAPLDDSRRRSTVTNANGRYEIANLGADTYSVTAELAAFRTAITRQRVTTGSREVWLVMEPGELRETVPIPARPPARIVPLQR